MPYSLPILQYYADYSKVGHFVDKFSDVVHLLAES